MFFPLSYGLSTQLSSNNGSSRLAEGPATTPAATTTAAAAQLHSDLWRNGDEARSCVCHGHTGSGVGPAGAAVHVALFNTVN